ncbi:MAG: hypothetical protein BWX54_01984 [Verrucomicrobia bacterium ADurb.Bin018]|nr:MAG: hypothetical protein BWX54_01984 [Verrucomicrobia bacterium ADurb.Bin018]
MPHGITVRHITSKKPEVCGALAIRCHWSRQVYHTTLHSEPKPRKLTPGAWNIHHAFSGYSSRPGSTQSPVRTSTRMENSARCNMARTTSSAVRGANIQNVANSLMPTP